MTKSILNSVIATGLIWAILACGGLKVGGYDIGKIAQTGANVISGSELDEEQQKIIGMKMAAIILGSSSLHKDESLQAYVNKVGSWVASQAGSSEKKWQFMVIDTPDFNAFSTPGGYVIISSGVIDRLSSEAELAGILAHEISHVAQQHQVKAIEKSNTYSNWGELAFVAADANQTRKGGYSKKSMMNTTIAENLFDMTHSLYTKGMGRDDELDADIRAVVLTARAGYDPYAYLSVMQLVDSIDNKNKTLLLATHPKTSKRIEVVAKTIEKITLVTRQTKSLESRFIKET